MNRGSGHGSAGLHARDARASMRPRFMNRGSTLWVRSSSTSLSGFNEAPIHESGKWIRSSSCRSSLPGFNEAPIHESGKWGRSATDVQRSSASMRPRFMNRGSRDGLGVLGRGHDRFNEAPIHESGKCSTVWARKRPHRCFNEAPIHESGKCDSPLWTI